MHSIHRLKAEELNEDFLKGLKLIFKDQEIEIIVSTVEQDQKNKDKRVDLLAEI